MIIVIIVIMSLKTFFKAKTRVKRLYEYDTSDDSDLLNEFFDGELYYEEDEYEGLEDLFDNEFYFEELEQEEQVGQAPEGDGVHGGEPEPLPEGGEDVDPEVDQDEGEAEAEAEGEGEDGDGATGLHHGHGQILIFFLSMVVAAYF